MVRTIDLSGLGTTRTKRLSGSDSNLILEKKQKNRARDQISDFCRFCGGISTFSKMLLHGAPAPRGCPGSLRGCRWCLTSGMSYKPVRAWSGKSKRIVLGLLILGHGRGILKSFALPAFRVKVAFRPPDPLRFHHKCFGVWLQIP